jgi:hypothetical protein
VGSRELPVVWQRLPAGKLKIVAYKLPVSRREVLQGDWMAKPAVLRHARASSAGHGGNPHNQFWMLFNPGTWV